MNKHYKPMFLLLLLLTVSVCVRAQTQYGSLYGWIIDKDGKPLAEVTVSIDRIGIKRHFETKSDSNGLYNHVGLPKGRYELTITNHGKLMKLDTYINFDDESKVDFDLRQLQPYDPEQKYRVTPTGLTIPPKAQRELQRSFDAKDDLDAAQKHLEKALQIAPDFEEALNDLGLIYHRKQQYAEAAALFERALKINPGSITVRVNLGATLNDMKEYERALSENLRVLAVRPHDAQAHAQAGLSLFYLNRYEEAITHFQEAKQLDPASTFVPGLFLASIYDTLGMEEEAVAEYAEFLQNHPGDQARARIESRLSELKSGHSRR